MIDSSFETTSLKKYIETPVRNMRKYDLRNLTLRKTEDALTGLLASEINSINIELLAYEQVLIPKSKPDLFLVKNRSLRWDSDDFYPEFYFEFKFKANFDLLLFTQSNLRGDVNINKVANYVENLEDLDKLLEYKLAKRRTRCIQGFYVCYNPSSTVYKEYSLGGSRDGIPSFIDKYSDASSRASMNSDFLKAIEKSTNENARKWRSLLENEKLKTCLIEPRGEFPIIQEDEFWLELVLFEVKNSE